MIGYIVALLPLYMFVYLPISHMIYGTSEKTSVQQTTNFNSSFIATNEPLACPSHNYNTFILSHEPSIVYIENFLSSDESQHLLEIR
jgi:prolyl 4-hydroxylase